MTKDLTTLAEVEAAYKTAAEELAAKGWSQKKEDRLGRAVHSRISTDLTLWEEASLVWFHTWFIRECAKIKAAQTGVSADEEVASITAYMRRKPFVRDASGRPVSKVRRIQTVDEIVDDLVRFENALGSI